MRFISSHRGYEMSLRNPRITGFTQLGDPIYDGNYLKAEFQQGGVSPWEEETAIKSLVFKGMYDGENPAERLSWFDTETAQIHYGWSDEEREIAEQKLLNSDGIGREYMLVEQPRLAAPWSSYDDLKDPKRIVELMLATGTSKNTLLAYERQNKNRVAVIDAVESYEDTPADTAVVVNA